MGDAFLCEAVFPETTVGLVWNGPLNDTGGEEGLPVGGEVLTELSYFIFALVECLAHKCLILIPGFRQHSDA